MCYDRYVLFSCGSSDDKVACQMILEKKGLIGYQVTMPLFFILFSVLLYFSDHFFFYLILISSFFVAWIIIAVMVGVLTGKTFPCLLTFFSLL